MNQKDKLRHILNDNEKVLWFEKPARLPYYLTTMPSSLVLIIFGACEFLVLRYFFFPTFFMPGDAELPWIANLMIAVFCLPFFIGILYPFYIILSYKNLLYAFTDKRVIIRSGAWGADYITTEYDKIADIEVKVGPIGDSYGTGNIRFVTGTSEKGQKLGQTMYAISDPYAVFKKVKKIALDIKSDVYFPNELRPLQNSGYRTEYKP